MAQRGGNEEKYSRYIFFLPRGKEMTDFCRSNKSISQQSFQLVVETKFRIYFELHLRKDRNPRDKRKSRKIKLHSKIPFISSAQLKKVHFRAIVSFKQLAIANSFFRRVSRYAWTKKRKNVRVSLTWDRGNVVIHLTCEKRDNIAVLR